MISEIDASILVRLPMALVALAARYRCPLDVMRIRLELPFDGRPSTLGDRMAVKTR